MFDSAAFQKKNYFLPTAKITNPDVTRLINSSEIHAVVRPANAKITRRPWTQHKNPLTNKQVLFRLNPYAKTLRSQELRTYPYIYALSLSLTHFFTVKQERCKKAAATKKAEVTASDAFKTTLFAP